MNWNDFEKHVKNTLHDQEIALDTNALVKSIFQTEKKKRRILPFWWIMAGVVLLAGIPYGAYKISSTKKQVTSVQKRTLAKATVEKETSAPKEVAGKESMDKSNSKSLITPLITWPKTNHNHPSRIYTDQTTSAHLTSSENVILHDMKFGSDVRPMLLAETNKLQHLWGDIKSVHKPVFPRKKTTECPSFSNKKKFLFFVQPEFGMSVPYKTLIERIPDNSEVTAFRKENEKTLEGLHGAIYGGMTLGNSPFYVKTGLAYTRLAERLDLSYNYTRKDTTFGIISITKSQNGDTITVIYGDIVTETQVKGQKIKHHYFHIFDVPLCVGYQRAISPKWNLGVEAGLSLNVALLAEGQVLNTLNDFKPVEKSHYQKSLGLGYRGGVEIAYRLMPGTSLGLQCRLNGYGKSFTSPHSNFKQNYVIPSAQLSLKYLFASN